MATDKAFDLIREIVGLRIKVSSNYPNDIDLNEIVDKVYDLASDVAEAAVSHASAPPSMDDDGNPIEYKVGKP